MMNTTTKAAKAARKTAKAKAKAAADSQPDSAADLVTEAPKAKPAAGERADGLRAGSKMAIAVDMVCRKRGATCPEIAEALGWTALNSSTLRRYCEGAKVKLREDDAETPSRWFGTPR
jgi:hypothetical protein